MKIIEQRVKAIMEECKKRARDAGLSFDNESIEYIVTNADLVDLGPKYMIPTLYDYWVHDINLMKNRKIYEMYPSNPYETVINTRPAMSFYNDNNPDWLNVMIFYHVLGHIDFFQNNLFFERTWRDDFCGRALSDKVLIDKIRREQGAKKRYVDYVIECARSLDNIVGYHRELSKDSACDSVKLSGWLDYYLNAYVSKKQVKYTLNVQKEIKEYNDLLVLHGEKTAQKIFLESVKKKFPEFEGSFDRFTKSFQRKENDVLDFLMNSSPFMGRPENSWTKEIVSIIRETSLYFQPQIRTKIINEGWASYWHQLLFAKDERISGNEVNYARVNSGVMTVPKIGLNPYAIGYLLLQHIYEMGEKGKFDYLFQKNRDMDYRKSYNSSKGGGDEAIFYVRTNCDDAMLINFLSEMDFQDFVDRNNLFVVGKRLNEEKGKIQYYVKSRRGEDYRNMLLNDLNDTPYISVNQKKSKKGSLFLQHHFEGKQLVDKYLKNVLFYTSYLWGGTVQLATTEISYAKKSRFSRLLDEYDEGEQIMTKVIYTMEDNKFHRQEVDS